MRAWWYHYGFGIVWGAALATVLLTLVACNVIWYQMILGAS